MLTSLDLAIVVLSLVATLWVGLLYARRARGTEEYFLAGRDLTWPFVGFSLFATNISSEHFVGLAAGGHHQGLVQGGYEWIASYCLLMLALVFAPQYLKHRVFTIPEFFEKRYGIEARLGLSAYFLAMIVLTKTAVAIYAGSLVVQKFTGWELPWIWWGIGIFTALYTIGGGLAAVVYTDFIQALMLIAGSAVLTWAAMAEVGGWSGLRAGLEAQNALAHLSMVKPPDDPDLPFSGFLLGNFLIGGMFYWCMDQVNVQRVLGARDLHHARLGAILAGFLKIIPVFILVLPGVAARVLYPEIGEEHNSTYGVLVERLLPAGLKGVVVAALLAALMSSLSSTFNSASTLVARDFVLRFRPGTSTRAQIRIGRLGLAAVMVAGVLCAPLVDLYENLWIYLQEVTGYLSVPFAVAGLLGILSRRINRWGALSGITVGIAAGAFFLTESKLELEDRLITTPYLASFLHRTFLCALLSAGAMIAVSASTKPPPEEVLRGSFHLFGGPREDRGTGEGDSRSYIFWAALLFVVVAVLWWAFR
jgi:SSS family solute:Na+ symporter